MNIEELVADGNRGWYCWLTNQVTLGHEETCDLYAGDDHAGCGWRIVAAALTPPGEDK